MASQTLVLVRKDFFTLGSTLASPLRLVIRERAFIVRPLTPRTGPSTARTLPLLPIRSLMELRRSFSIAEISAKHVRRVAILARAT
jgi:hypothetical protein